MFTADPFVQQYGFPIKRYEANNKLPALVMSLYKPHCQTKELKQRYCKVTPAHCEGKERGWGGERVTHTQRNHIIKQ